jgi:hypothetical protein
MPVLGEASAAGLLGIGVDGDDGDGRAGATDGAWSIGPSAQPARPTVTRRHAAKAMDRRFIRIGANDARQGFDAPLRSLTLHAGGPTLNS